MRGDYTPKALEERAQEEEDERKLRDYDAAMFYLRTAFDWVAPEIRGVRESLELIHKDLVGARDFSNRMMAERDEARRALAMLRSSIQDALRRNIEKETTR